MARREQDLGFPATLPMAYVLRSVSLEEFLEAQGYSLEQWDLISKNRLFRTAVAEAEKMVNDEGGAFRIKARAMAEQFLPEAEELVRHPDTPPAVKGDMIKAIIKFAGLDGSVDQRTSKPQGNAVQINIDLG